MHLDLIQAISLAGNEAIANEDRIGLAVTSAWVIDGATDLAGPSLMGDRSGSVWLATTADAAFSRRCALDERNALHSLVREVHEDIASAYLLERKRSPVAEWEKPSAAFLAVKVTTSAIEVAWVADCTCLVATGGDIRHRIGWGRPNTERALAGPAVAACESPTIDRLRARRAQPDRQAMTIDVESYRHVQFASVPCEPGDELILMTDGFAALIDEYGLHDGEFLSLLRSQGLAGLAIKLRTIEASDPGRARFSRVKRSDDASAIWLRVA